MKSKVSKSLWTGNPAALIRDCKALECRLATSSSISRVTQRAKWIQRPDSFLCLLGRIDALRFVDDDDGPGRLDEFDRLAAGEPVAFLVDDVAFLLRLGAGEVLAEGVDIDDENLERGADRKLPKAVDLLGVVDEMLERQVVV